MDYFFTTQEHIPAGLGFRLYGAGHLCWLLGGAAAAAVLCVCYRRAGPSGRRKLGLAVCGVCLGIEIIKDIMLFATGQFLLNYLPLDLCGIAIFGEGLCALRPGPLKKELCYCLFMPGALMALLFPNWTPLPFWNLMSLHSFLLHILLVAYPLMLLSGGDFRPNPKNLPKCFGIGLAMCPPIYLVDRLWNENFFFLNVPSPDSPLSLFAQWWGSPGYLLSLPLITWSVWLALYLPFALVRKHRGENM